MPNPDDKPYAAVFLDEDSQLKLIEWWEVALGIPLLPMSYAHHMTVKYDPSEEDILEIEVGQQTSLRVVGYAYDACGQAVLVQPQVFCHNKYPHVTVATAPGIGPVYSNELLATGFRKVAGPRLTGVVDIRID